MAARLPAPGGDEGQWGDILNDFLSQSHNSDGTLKQTAISSAASTLFDANGAAAAGQSASNSYTDTQISNLHGTYVSIPSPSEQVVYVSPRGSDANDGLSIASAKLTVSAALAALASSGAGNRGVIQLGYGTISLGSSELLLSANSNGDDFGPRGLTIRGMGVGLTVLDASAQSGITAMHLASASKMYINLSDFELLGPGKANAGSRGIYWESPGGSFNWQNLYIHDFETGVEFYDSTLGSAINIAIRRCAAGLAADYQTDIQNWIGCRFDYNDLALHIGNPTSSHPNTVSQEENCQKFLGCRISNNQTAIWLDDFGASGIDFDNCYFEGNTKQGTIGQNGRTDNSGPAVHFGGCYWDPYITNSDGSHNTAQQAAAIDVYNSATLVFDKGCKVSGPTKFAVFVNLVNTNATVRIADSILQAQTAVVQQGGITWSAGSNGNGGLQVGTTVHTDYAAGGAIASTGWRRHQLSNRTGKILESWEGLSSADGSILSQVAVRDIGGVMHIEGVNNGGVGFLRVSSLPAPSASWYGIAAVLIGGTGAADVPYVCSLNSSGSYAWTPLTGGIGPAGLAGPGSWGIPRTADPGLIPATARSMSSANDVRYFRLKDSGTITSLKLNLAAASAGGTLAAGIYRNNGSSGAAARPSGTCIAQGTVSTSTTGNLTISLGVSVSVSDGDWVGVGIDNTGAGVAGNAGISIDGFSYLQSNAMSAGLLPVPASLVLSGQLWGICGA